MFFIADSFHLMEYAKKLYSVDILHDSTKYIQAINHWAKENNCTHFRHYIMECSEEDFIVLKLKHSDAITKIFYENH
jgi:hypothetical protein